MFYIYKCIFLKLQKSKCLKESAIIFTKYLLPVYQKFSNFHTSYIKAKPQLTIEERIKICTEKILNTLENAKDLSLEEKNEGNKYEEETELSCIDLDYETLHTEILDNIIITENDSGISDMEENLYKDPSEKDKQKYFESTKIKRIVQRSIKSLFSECQEEEQYKPLLEQQNLKESLFKSEKNDLRNNYDNKKIDTIISTSPLTIEEVKQEDKKIGDIKNSKEESINDCNIINNNESNENIVEKEENELISFKKYDYFSDPYSNFNNFTKKFKIVKNTQKRLKDIHPFLKTFNPKFLKKENIDKKIFRRFRNYVKKLYKKQSEELIFSKNREFWKIFSKKNLLPPMKLVYNEETIQYKSFNTNYLIWLFNQEGSVELFKKFSKEEGENVINNFVKEYKLLQSSESGIIEKLKQYLNKIPEIYNYVPPTSNIQLNEEKENLLETNLFSLFETEDYYSGPSAFQLSFPSLFKKSFKETCYNDLSSGLNRLNNCSSIKAFMNQKSFEKKDEFSDLNEQVLCAFN